MLNVAVPTHPSTAAPVCRTHSRYRAKSVNVFYGEKHAIKDVNIDIRDRGVTAFIGPSGCGKSTFLRSINRMNDTIAACR